MSKCPSMDRNNPMYEFADPHVPEPPQKCDGCGVIIDRRLEVKKPRPLRWSPYMCAECNFEIDALFKIMWQATDEDGAA
jgi:hypothetical protein